MQQKNSLYTLLVSALDLPLPGGKERLPFSGGSEEEVNRPLRDEILARDKLERLAGDLAETHNGKLAERRGGDVFQRFRDNTQALELAYFEFARAIKENRPLAPGAEWLLDNYHVIEEHVRDIRAHLPRGYYRSLPKLTEGEFAGYPRIYHLATELITHTDSIVSRDTLTAFIHAYQEKSSLKIGELWAVPIMIRLALVDNLRRLAFVSLISKSEREEIDELIDSLILDPSQTASEALLMLAPRFKVRPHLSIAASVHALRRLRGLGTKGWLCLQWLEERLREQGHDPEEIVRAEHQFEAANQISIGNCVTSLKAVSSLDWKSWVEELSVIDGILRADPHGTFRRCDFTTRDFYRHVVEQYARKAKKAEADVAGAAVALAEGGVSSTGLRNEIDGRKRHIGYYLLDEGIDQLEREIGFEPGLGLKLLRYTKSWTLFIYGSSIFLLTGLLLFQLQRVLASLGTEPAIAMAAVLLFFIPGISLANDLVQWIVTWFRRPTRLPKLDLEESIPDDLCTVVVVHGIFHDAASIAGAAELLEVRFLGNTDPNLSFALLADLPSAPAERMPEDDPIIEAGKKCIESLNSKYCRPGTEQFSLLFRYRKWNSSEGAFMGWERKRGKVTEFNRLLLGSDSTSFNIVVGSAEALRKHRFVITLDADSQLPRGSAALMIGTLAHPLNRPVIDPATNRVTSGYAIVQPRVGTSLTSSIISPFSKIFSGFTGLDPYTHAISDVYQDLFGEGTFVGKGIYDVSYFEHAMRGRVPENALLSHDLFESTFARTALATDIEIIDDFPTRYNTYSRRLHRWIRGDWQLFPWLFPIVPNEEGSFYKNPISSLGQWKISDNLRRSLIAPALFTFAVFAWCFLPGPALLWTGLTAAALFFPIVSLVLGAIFSPPVGVSKGVFFRALGRNALRNLTQTALVAAFLSYQAYLSVHAIAITLFRVYVSKRRMLEWQTASSAEKKAGSGIPAFVREMAPGTILGVLALFSVVYFAPGQLWGAAPLLVPWIFSPLIGAFVSRPARHSSAALPEAEHDYLREIAWETWQYFDDHLIERYNYLMPDNLQVVPQPVVAERTSPTNIALSILSVISAYDLGFIPLPAVLDRLGHIFDSLRKLDRYNGHFLNWYQIVRFEPLRPRYVSMVDSGNFAAHLVTTRVALETFSHAPLLSSEHAQHLANRVRSTLSGTSVEKAVLPVVASFESLAPEHGPELWFFLDKAQELRRLISSDHDALQRSARLLKELELILQYQDLAKWLEEFVRLDQKLTASREKLQNDALADDLHALLCTSKDRIFSFDFLLEIIPKTVVGAKELLRTAKEKRLDDLVQGAEALVNLLGTASGEMETLLRKRRSLIDDCSRYVDEMDFRFLFDSDKRLFTIGYNIDDARKDNSYYDLLASEARLGSLLAIAKEDVPQQHWFMLGRMLADSPGGQALLSWSATMFEYLMPLLVTKDFPGTILSESYRAVVRTQKHYGRQRGVPWGISESGYSGVDYEKTYQYRAFGVPGLGLKRGLSEDLVVSPYSTFLALPIDAPECVKNIRNLEGFGMRGEYGFYESIDFTKERLTAEENGHIVRSFFCHHQGMILVSLTNFLRRGIFQERFHADPAVRSTELLLQERFPERIPSIVPHQAELSFIEREKELPIGRERKFTTPHTPLPEAHILSNSRYSVVIDNEGSGYSFVERAVALTRWREDSCTNDFGSYVYIRDIGSGTMWSAAYQPTLAEPEHYEAIFNPDKAEFRRVDHGIALHTEIAVSPEENVEIRRLTFHNLSEKERQLELTSYQEVVLGHNRGDLAHPAFSKMFVQSEFLEDYDALLFRRRPRSDHEETLFLLHMLTMNVVWDKTQYETSRANFLGRGRTPHRPIVFDGTEPLSGTVGSVLDPVASLRTRVEMNRGDSVSLSFITAFTKSREEALNLARKYRESALISRAFEMAWSQSNIEIRFEHFSLAQTFVFQELASAILFNNPILRADPSVISSNRHTQSALWRFGISGDHAIVLLRIADPAQLALLKELLLAHDYLKVRMFEFDLVILNEYPGGYLQKFQEEIESMIRTGHFGNLGEGQRGVFVRNLSQLSSEEVNLLKAVARVVLDGGDGSLAQQLHEINEEIPPRIIPPRPPARRTPRKKPVVTPRDAEYFNGVGGFVDGGKAYSLVVTPESLPPFPWSNVVANSNFGFFVTESGGGYTWSDNSRENRLSPWSNDPVTDGRGEAVYIRDPNTSEFFSATPLPAPGDSPYEVTHGFGASTFLTEQNKITSSLTLSCSAEGKTKFWRLKLKNNSNEARELEVFLFIDWVIGILRQDSYRHITTDFDSSHEIITAVNRYNNEFAENVVFAGCDRELLSYTTDRLEFLGRHRDLSCPIAFEGALPPVSPAVEHAVLAGIASILGKMKGPPKLSKRIGAGFESCAALAVNETLAPGASAEITFFLGVVPSVSEARRTVKHLRSPRVAVQEIEDSRRSFKALASDIEVSTPDRSFDIMMNGWLLYQTISCRIQGRTALYQSGGAFGFRDQLQDTLAFLYTRPEITRKQILLHASRQFAEGDVQHWWHPPTGRGVRTRISDDYLWLPYAVHQYLEATGDEGILDADAPYIEGRPLEEHEMESYIVPNVSGKVENIYAHSVLALDRALVYGPHGLPLIGGGDWNDGMNEVGRHGKGESVWLGWFLARTLVDFAEICERRKDAERANRYRQESAKLVKSIEEHGWDGDWYRRAFFDDGTPLGSKPSDVCKIDSLSQSWSVITGLGQAERANKAMDAVYEKLVRRKDRLIALLDPPFDKTDHNPGYIKGYLPGIRENGGQYTHAATWVILATAKLGRGELAHELFSLINPINLTSAPDRVSLYKAEPYVLCGDVYATPPLTGHAGWSWYTGSSGWMYRVGLEGMLGFRIEHGTTLKIDPRIPRSWKEFSLRYTRKGVTYNVEVKNPSGVEAGVKEVTVDGQKQQSNAVPLKEAGKAGETVTVQVIMG